MDARDLGVFQLHLGLLQALLNRVLLLGAAPAQAPLQLFLRRRGDEDVAGGELGGLDLLHALHLDIQNDGLALGGLLLDRGLRRAVEVVTKLRAVVWVSAGARLESGGCGFQRVPLDEAVLGLQLQERILRDEVVVDAVLLAGPRAAGRVGDREGEGVRVSLSRLSGIAIAHGW